MAGRNLLDALLYLKARSLQNLLLSRVRRLKQPKYLVGAIIGLAYLYFAFGRRFMAQPRPRRGPSLEEFAGDGLTLAPIFGAAGVLLFIGLCWVLRRQRAALSFSEAEIAFLFPAPASRRALIHYRLISTGLATVFTALILGLVSAQWPGMSGHFGMRFVGWWLLFATLSLHTIGSGFTISRWQDRGASPLLCQVLALVVFAVAVGPPLAWLWQVMQGGAVSWVGALREGPVAWLLLPFGVLLEPLLAADGPAFLLAVVPALIIHVGHYFWVLLVQVGFEEASIAKAEKRAAVMAAMRGGNWRVGARIQKARRAPFDIGREGRPELAFLWKNLLASAEYLRPRTALIAAALIVFGCTWFADSPLFMDMRPALSIVTLTLAAYTLLLGPQLARQDFRSDLQNTDILKTYPLRGWQIMLGELLTPTAILTVLLWLMLLAGALLLPVDMPRLAWLAPSLRTVATMGLVLLAPLLCMSQLVIVNTAAVLLPAWQAGPGRIQQGIEVMGQRILFLAGQLFTMAVMLLPAVIIAAVAFTLSRWVVSDGIAIGIAAVLVAATLAAEIGLAIYWLGERFERLDLSRELRP